MRDSRRPGTFVIASAEALARFRRESAHFLDRGVYQHIEVALPVARRERFEGRINAHYRECGCVASAIAVLLTIAGLVAWNVAGSALQTYGWRDIALDIGIVLLAGALGKVLAIARAHWGLRRTLIELASAFGGRQSGGDS